MMRKRSAPRPPLFLEALEARDLLSVTASSSLLLKLSPNTSLQAAEASLLPPGGVYSVQPTSVANLYTVSASPDQLSALAKVAAGEPFVQYVEPNSQVHDDLAPNDPSFSNNTLYGLNGAWGIKAPGAWDATTGSTSVVIADIDTGVDYDHPDLYENIWINQAEIPTIPFTTAFDNEYGLPLGSSRRSILQDTDGDGLITFYDLNNPIDQGPGKITDINGDGRIDGSDILAPMTTTTDAQAGQNAALYDTGSGGWAYSGNTQDGDTAHPNDLIGWNFVDNTNDPFDDNGHGSFTAGELGAIGNNGTGVVGVNWQTQIMPLKFLDSSGSGTDANAIDAIEYAIRHGANLSSNSWGGTDYGQGLYNAISDAESAGEIFVAAAGNSSQNNDTNPFYPAAYNLPNIIAVAATDSNGNLASFSNYGPTTVQIAAPGVNNYSTYPDVDYGYASGTSEAAPYVAGVAGLVLAQHPTWTYSQVINQIMSTVTPDPSLKGLTVSGGIVNALGAVQVQGGDLNWSGGGLGSLPTLSPGVPFTVTRTYTISGQAAPSNFGIAYYGSNSSDPNQDLTTADFLGEEIISASADKTVGTHGGTSSALMFPQNVYPYLIACLDPGNVILETNESNNVTAAATGAPPVPVQIVDDSSRQGFSTTGSWSTATNQGYDGTVDYAAAGSGSVATWTFTVTPDQYDVAATWYAYSNRATNSPYTVLDGSTPRGTVLVNQQLAPSGFTDQGGTWQDLGTFTINGNQLVVQLSDNANGYVIADAIRIQNVGNVPTVQMQDGATLIANGGSDSFGTTTVGSPVTRTFTVTNGGTQTLTLGAFGTIPAGFTLTQGFGSTSLAPGAFTTFQVSLSATAAGSPSGTLSFATTDSNFPTYSFTISGTVQGPTQIIDDSSSQGFTTTGPWQAYSSSGWPMYDGNTHFIAAGTGSNVASWTFTVTPGQYDVSATWWAIANRATNAPYTVLDGSTPRGTVLVNQQLAPSGFTDQGGTWQDLGTFTINGNQLVVQLSDNANGYVIADAIRIQNVGNVPTVQVKDGSSLIANGGSDSFGTTTVGSPVTRTFTVTNGGTQTLTLGAFGTIPAGFTLTQGFGSTSLAVGASTTFQVSLTATAAGSPSGTLSFNTNDSNFPTYSFTISGTVQSASTTQIIDDSSSQGFTTTGPWQAYSNSSYPMYDGNTHYIAAGTGSNVASWTFTVTPGQYEVSATWWAIANRATNAPYTVLDGSTPRGTVLVNQQLAPSGFTDQGGTWQDLGTFTINGNQLVVQLSDNANGYVIADAIRIQNVGNVPTVQMQDGATLIANGGSDSFGTTTVGSPVTRTFTVTNGGTQTLTLGAFGTIPAGFTLTQGFGSTSLAPGAFTTFQVSLSATAAGSPSGTLSFATTDSNFPTYSFTISGTVQSASTTQIIDDSSSQGFTTTGPWQAYSNSSYPMYDGNTHYIAAGTGSNVASWTFTVTPGQYDVSATWWAIANRATNAPYTVLDGSTPLSTVLVNQQLAPSGFSDQGGTWQDLGSFTINGNQLVVQLSDNANGYVIADAIRIQNVGNPPTVQVKDGSSLIANGGSDSFGTTTVGSPVTRTFTVTNGGTQTLTLGAFGTIPAGFTLTQGFGSTSLAPGAFTTFQVSLSATAAGSPSGTLSFATTDSNFPTYSFTISGTVQGPTQIIDDSSSQGFTTTGPWQAYSSSGWPMYDGNTHFIAAGTGSNVASWTFTVTPGQYDVSATWWAIANRATNAPYTVLDGSTPRGTVLVNQQLAPSGFTDQGGTWQDLGTFTINGNQLVVQLSDNANGYVIADAIRIQNVGNVPTVQMQDGATLIANGGSDSFGTTTVGSPVTRTFTVTNGGTQTLTLGAFGTIPAGFTLTQGFGSTSLAPGAFTTFQVSLSATAAGSPSGTLSFATTDSNFPTYSFTISGTVQGPTQIIDDSSSQGFTTTGPWQAYSNSSYPMYDGNTHYIAAGTGSNVASWTFTVTPGQYDVSATWWAIANRATNAPYTVLDGSTPRGTVLVNQQLAPSGFSDQGGTWQDLGTFTINGNQLVVQLSDNANGYVIADAIRIEKLS